METTQRIKVSRGQIESLKLECVKSQVAEKELKSLPGEVRLYESLGRLWVHITSKNECHVM